LRKDGKRIHVFLTVSPVRDTAGNVTGALTNARDITERKRVEASLRESEAVFRGLSDCSPLGILLLNDQGQCTYANPRARVMFDVKATEFMGAGWTLHVNPAERQRLIDELVVAMHERAEYSTEFSLLTSGGTIRWVCMRTAAMRDPIGESLGHVATVEDITEHRNAEAALLDLYYRLLDAQDEERRRIARELHDSTAQKLASLMMNLGKLHDELVGKSAQARKVLRDSLALVEGCSVEIRTLSYLLHPPLLEELGLAVALRSYVEGFKNRSGIRVKLILPRGLKRLPAQLELALFRVIQESLGNIHRHSGSKTASIRLQRNPNRVVLEVKDKGCGLPSRQPNASKEKPKTAGVGIAGMTERLRRLAGQLEILSGERGTTVRATVPLKQTKK
jgi:PAS domain S-box-containing protein